MDILDSQKQLSDAFTTPHELVTSTTFLHQTNPTILMDAK